MPDSDMAEGDVVLFEGDRATISRAYDGTNMTIDREDDDPITVMPGHVTPVEDAPTTAIDGVGESRSNHLEEAGIETVGDVAAAGPEGLADTDLSEGHAEDIYDNAVSLLGE